MRKRKRIGNHYRVHHATGIAILSNPSLRFRQIPRATDRQGLKWRRKSLLCSTITVFLDWRHDSRLTPEALRRACIGH